MKRAAAIYLAVLTALGVAAGLAYFASALLVVGIYVGLPALWVHLTEQRRRRTTRVVTFPQRDAVIVHPPFGQRGAS